MIENYQVIVTGEHEELQEPVTTVNGKKIEWLQVPVLRFERLKVESSLIETFNTKPFEWIIFTSSRAVKFWSEAVLESGADFPIETQVACIGESTAARAAQDGFTPDFYPTEPGTEKFLEEFEHLLSNNSKKPSILIPMAEGGRLQIYDRLLELGCPITVIPLYRTFASDSVPLLLSLTQMQKASLVLFTSPSSVDAVTKHFERLPGVKIGAIGKFTANYLTEKRFEKISLLPGGNFERIGEILC